LERNPFSYAGNQVFHSLDLSYWNWRTVRDREGILAKDKLNEFVQQSYENWSNVRSLYFVEYFAISMFPSQYN
jgi:hypothetical protein